MSSRAHPAPAYRLKPAPRRKTGEAPLGRVRWDRLGRIALVLVLLVIMLGYIRPVSNLFEGWTEASSERDRLEQLQAENAALKEQSKGMSAANAAIIEARELGMVAEGEKPYVVRGLDR